MRVVLAWGSADIIRWRHQQEKRDLAPEVQHLLAVQTEILGLEHANTKQKTGVTAASESRAAQSDSSPLSYSVRQELSTELLTDGRWG